ncbi:MAG: fructose-6-phosphate aldolase [Candidatus Krumholzibacteria bacterium]|jgi:transaldolase|nr:fructose-6-phosphate aldolase [Candidatus Krumholzibacteria bacterium]
MKFFIDTANIAEIREAAKLGLLDGVTTNPTLLSREKGLFRETLREICSIVDGPVSAEVISLEAEGMVKEGRDLCKIADNIIIKVPCITEGIKAIGMFRAEGIQTNATLCFSANQGLLVAKAGATYVSPFVGRLDDVGQPGMDLIADLVTIYGNYAFATEIIVASIRSVQHVYESALLGADVATIPFKVIAQLVKHPLTDAGIKSFLSDWEKVEK